MASRVLRWIVVALATSGGGHALACRCLEPDPGVAYRRASAVIEAHVESVTGVPDGPGGATARVTVRQAWKADVPTSIDIHTSTTCAYPFKAGTDVLLFLTSGAASGPWTGKRCTGSQPVDDAGKAQAWLRRNARPAGIQGAAGTSASTAAR